MNLFDFSSQVALVTGASRGLGREMALALATAGADLVLTARDGKALAEIAEQLAAQTGRTVLACPGDVTDRAAVESAVALAMDRFGRLDVLVANAGINIRSPITQIVDEDFQAVQATNVTGVLNACRAAAAVMVKAKYGRIITMGSTLATVALPGRISYCASKGAVLQLTRALALDLARTGVTANCICPGPFATEINRALIDNPAASGEVLSKIPMGRWGELHEIAPVVLFLASPASSFVTGAVINVDGGWSAS